MSGKFKVAVAGLVHDHVWGNVEHFTGYRSTEVIAASDPNPPLRDKFAEKYPDATLFRDYRRMLDAVEPDIALVCTTNAGTANVIEACAERSVHVVSEKPMASKLAEADRILKACRKAKVHLMINWPTFWSPAITKLVDLVEDGLVGDVFQVRQRCAHAGPEETGCSRYFCDWLYNPRLNGAGALMDYCCYGAAFCRYLQGRPDAVTAFTGNLVKEHITVDDNAVMLLEYPNAISILEASWTQVGRLPFGIIVSGTEGSLMTDGETLQLYNAKDPDGRSLKVPKLPVWRSNPAKYFVRVLRGEIEMDGWVSPEISRDAQEILEAGVVSAGSHKACRVPVPSKMKRTGKSKDVNVAVVGYGLAGKSFHCYLVNLVDGLNLYGVMARREEVRKQARADWRVKTFATIEKMLADDAVGLVVVATPHNTHAEIALKAMNAGKHCVVDKIMCLSVAEADAMIEAGRSNEVMLSVFHNRRWDGDFLTVKKVLSEGLLGDPFIIESSVLRGVDRRRATGPRSWRGHAGQGGGQLRDWGAHLLDQAVQLMDCPVESVFCKMQNRWQETDIDDWVRAMLRFSNGVDYWIEVGGLTTIPRPRWYIRGSKGTLVKTGLDPQETPMRQGNIDAAEEDPADYARVCIDGEEEEQIVETIPGRWRSYYENIADVLLEDADLAVKPEEVRKMIVLTEACAESARTGEVVTFESE